MREVGVTVAKFLANGGAVEISPGLLFAPPSLSDYQSNPFLYRLRVSLATKSTQYGAREYAIGVRMAFINETDLRADKVLQDSLLLFGSRIGLRANNFSRNNPPDKLATFKKTLNKKYNDLIVGVREEAKARNWNKSILEFSITSVATSLDATYKHLLQKKIWRVANRWIPVVG